MNNPEPSTPISLARGEIKLGLPLCGPNKKRTRPLWAGGAHRVLPSGLLRGDARRCEATGNHGTVCVTFGLLHAVLMHEMIPLNIQRLFAIRGAGTLSMPLYGCARSAENQKSTRLG